MSLFVLHLYYLGKSQHGFIRFIQFHMKIGLTQHCWWPEVPDVYRRLISQKVSVSRNLSQKVIPSDIIKPEGHKNFYFWSYYHQEICPKGKTIYFRCDFLLTVCLDVHNEINVKLDVLNWWSPKLRSSYQLLPSRRVIAGLDGNQLILIAGFIWPSRRAKGYLLGTIKRRALRQLGVQTTRIKR